MKKQLWVLAGGNGAGKSTFYKTRIEPLGIPFLNTDILASQLYPEQTEQHSYDAAKIVTSLRSRLIHEGQTFCFETVFSHPSKVDFIAQAKTLGYEIILVFIHLECDQLNQARVAQRVSTGGHSVPTEKIITRIPRVLHWIKQAIPLCDQFYILDNSSASNPYRQIAVVKNTRIIQKLDSLPAWAISLLDISQ